MIKKQHVPINFSAMRLLAVLLTQFVAVVKVSAFSVECGFEKNPKSVRVAERKAFKQKGLLWDFGGVPFNFPPWKFQPGGLGNAKVRWITGKAGVDTHNGKHALYVKQLKNTGGRGAHFFLETPLLKPALKMTGSIYACGKGAIELRLYLYGDTITNKTLQIITIDGKAWRKYAFKNFFVKPYEAKHARVVLVFHGEIRCDDIVIKEVVKKMSSVEKSSFGVKLPKGAEIVFEEDFNRPDALVGWIRHKGDWRLESNALHTSGRQAYIVYGKPLGKNLRVEYTTWSDENIPYDLSAILNADPKVANWRSGSYYFAFGSISNLENFIFARGEILERNRMVLAGNEGGIVPGKHHRVIAQKSGNRLTLFVDGKEILKTRDMFAGTMKGKSFGFFIHKPGYIDDVKVYKLPDSAEGEEQAELNPKINIYNGFDRTKELPFPFGFEINDAKRVGLANIPTWIYQEKNRKPEKYVNDRCLKIAPENNIVNIVKKMKAVKSGIIEFDLLGENLGEDGISFSLLGVDGQITSTFLIDKNGNYQLLSKAGKIKLLDKIEYMRRRTAPARFFFRKNRWYTLRIAFDCKADAIRNIAIINLFTPMKFKYNAFVDKSKGEFYSLGDSLKFTKNASKIAGISIQASKQSRFYLDNLCIIGPVGHTFVNGKDRRLSLRTLMSLTFPKRKDYFDVKMLSMRNLHNTRKKNGRESCYSGYSYFLSHDKSSPAYKPFNEAAEEYNRLLVRQAFLREKGQMLKRTVYYLKNTGCGNEYSQRQFEEAFQKVANSDELLQEAYRTYAKSFINSLNFKELNQFFTPAAAKLKHVIAQAEKLIKEAIENLPEKSIPEKMKIAICPSPIPKTKPAWENEEWRRDGKPCFYYYSMFAIPSQIAKTLRFSPPLFCLFTLPMPLKTGKYINTSYCLKRYRQLADGETESDFYFNTRCGLHFSEFEVPRWWLDAFSKKDPDIFFRDADGNGPLKSQKHLNAIKFFEKHKNSNRSACVSLNFWNDNVREMLNAKFGAFSKTIKNDFKNNFAFYVLGWEAGNYGPQSIETGHNSSAERAFRIFLKKEYVSIDTLNKKWGTAYQTFKEITPPKKPIAPCGVQYEFQRFRQHGYKSWVDVCRNAIKKNSSTQPIVFDTQKSMFGPRKNGFDIPTYFEMTDIVAFHTYDERDRKVNDRLLDSARKACGKTIGNNEWSAVQCCPEMFVENVLKNNGIQAAFHRMMWGQGMSTIWYQLTASDWLDSVSTAEPRLGGLILRYHSTYIPLLMDRARRFGRIALQAPSVQPDVAILELTSSYYNALPVGIMRRGMEDIAVALEKKGYNYGFLFEQLLLDKKQSLSGIQTIIIVNGTCLPKSLAVQLEEWVKKGGTLICLAPIGVYNRYGQPAGEFLNNGFPGVAWKPDKLFNWTPEGGGTPSPVSILNNCEIYAARLSKGELYVFSKADVDKNIQKAVVNIIAEKTQRSFYSKNCKFDLCLRELNGKFFLYVLNPSLKSCAEDEIIVQGKMTKIFDKGLQLPVAVPVEYEKGETIIKMKLAPAEGALLEFILAPLESGLVM